jgi:uncharacterized protein (TIGR00269 family)
MDVEGAVLATIEKYDLFSKKDRVGVAVSGGKDSVVLLYVLRKLGFDVVAVMLDLEIGGWSKKHRENVERFCYENEIELRVFGFGDFFEKSFGEVINEVAGKKNVSRCSVCGVAKRWGLNRFAREVGVDVLATGHNVDDEAQNVLMNFLKGNAELASGFGPVSGSRDDLGFVRRVKPFFFVPESEVLKYSRARGFDILYDACPNAVGTYRVELRRWMDENLSDGEKVGVVMNFLEKVGGVEVDSCEVERCEVCGEVSRGRVCGFCEMLDCMMECRDFY